MCLSKTRAITNFREILYSFLFLTLKSYINIAVVLWLLREYTITIEVMIKAWCDYTMKYYMFLWCVAVTWTHNHTMNILNVLRTLQLYYLSTPIARNMRLSTIAPFTDWPGIYLKPVDWPLLINWLDTLS